MFGSHKNITSHPMGIQHNKLFSSVESNHWNYKIRKTCFTKSTHKRSSYDIQDETTLTLDCVFVGWLLPCSKQTRRQQQPSTGGLRKRFSENMQQIYRRTPMLKCDFNKVFIEIALPHRCFPINLLHNIRTPIKKNTFEKLLWRRNFSRSVCRTLQNIFDGAIFAKMILNTPLFRISISGLRDPCFQLSQNFTTKKTSRNLNFF